jgi:hypothetical protein
MILFTVLHIGFPLGPVNMRELLQQILSAARSVNNAVVLRKVTSSLDTRVRKFIQADERHFKQLA